MVSATRGFFLVVFVLLAGVVRVTTASAAPVPDAVRAAPGGQNGPVIVSTMPVTEGLPVTVDGIEMRTDASGVAVFPAQPGRPPMIPIEFSSRISATEFETVHNGQPVRFFPARLINSGGQPVFLLNVYWKVSLSFVNSANGGVVDPARIEEVTMRNSIGERISFDPEQPIWVQGSRVVAITGGLVNKKIRMTVQNVMYDGSNLVNASQQSFDPADLQSFRVELLFFSVRLSVTDAFFGFPTGSAIRLVFPDEHVEEYQLDESGALYLPVMPRGTYRLTVLGAGVPISRPITVSRDQEVELTLYSYLDVALAVLLFGAFIASTLWLGIARKHRFVRRGDKSPAEIEPEAEQAVDRSNDQEVAEAGDDQNEETPRSRAREDALV
jgi:hypothetical protein